MGSQTPLLKQIVNFIIHLRWHYQVFILSGGFLLGGYLSPTIDWANFAAQFLNVHLLLFGGATAYNSYWDKDEGPVGGLQHPPPMHDWMWSASLLLQAVGLVIAFWSRFTFAIIYLVSILFFWFYSTPHFRWKRTPVRSLIAIGISTGSNSLLMGYLAAGNGAIPSLIWMASLGVALVILSLYPTSQLFQIDEDASRGDQTFAVKFGFVGVIRFFQVAFTCGILILGITLLKENWWVGLTFTIVGALTGFWIYNQLKTLTANADDYKKVMRIKYLTSFAMVSFFIVMLLLKHI